jgi:hypothetical protein
MRSFIPILFTALLAESGSLQVPFIDKTICFPDFQPAKIGAQTRVIKQYSGDEHFNALTEVIILDSLFRPIQFIYGGDLALKDTNDIVHINYDRPVKSKITRIDEIFRSSSNFTDKAYDQEMQFVKMRKLDKSGRLVVKTIYTVSETDVTAGRIFPNDGDTIRNADILIYFKSPEFFTTDYGLDSIAREPVPHVFRYDTLGDQVVARIGQNVTQIMQRRNGQVQTIQDFGADTVVQSIAHDAKKRVTSIEQRGKNGVVKDLKQYFYRADGRIDYVIHTFEKLKQRQTYLYPKGRRGNVAKMIRFQNMDDGKKNPVFRKEFYSATGYLFREEDLKKDVLNKYFYVFDEYRLERE